MKKYKKTIAAAVGLLTSLMADGVLSGSAASTARALIAAATVAGVYKVRNRA